MLSRFSHVWLFETPRTVACQIPLFMGFSWSGLPCSLPGDLPDPGTELKSLMSPALAGRLFTTSSTWEDEIIQVKDNHPLNKEVASYVPWAKSDQMSVFVNKVLLEHSHAYLLIHLLSMAAFMLQEQSWIVATKTEWLRKPKIFTIWSFQDKACQSVT